MLSILINPEDEETIDGLHLEARRAGVTLQRFVMHVLTYAISPETRAYLATGKTKQKAQRAKAA